MRYYEMHNNSHYRWLQRSMPLKLQSTGSVEIDANGMRMTREYILLHSHRHDCGAVCSRLGAAIPCSRVCGYGQGVVRRAATIFDD